MVIVLSGLTVIRIPQPVSSPVGGHCVNRAALACPALNSESAIPIAVTRRTTPGFPLILAIFTSAKLGGSIALATDTVVDRRDRRIKTRGSPLGGSTFSARDAI